MSAESLDKLNPADIQIKHSFFAKLEKHPSLSDVGVSGGHTPTKQQMLQIAGASNNTVHSTLMQKFRAQQAMMGANAAFSAFQARGGSA